MKRREFFVRFLALVAGVPVIDSLRAYRPGVKKVPWKLQAKEDIQWLRTGRLGSITRFRVYVPNDSPL